MTRVEIEPVEGSKARESFIRLPWSLYRDDPAWVPPLLMERRDHLNANKNPLFRKAKVRLWRALRDGKPVGRISAQINRAHLERHGATTGHFGMLEAEDEAETFAALTEAAADWLREGGMTAMQGPFNLSINEESGLLVSGFESPPCMLMGHARPYYSRRLEELGFAKVKDLVCYRYDAGLSLPRAVEKMVAKAQRSDGLKVRPLDESRFQRDLWAIMAIFNDAWSENWNFIPFEEAEIAHMAKALKPIIEPGYVAIAELGGKPTAMAVALPNVNEAITDLNGRLLPFGWAKLLWRLKVRHPKSARIALMGVAKEHQGHTPGRGPGVFGHRCRARLPVGSRRASGRAVLGSRGQRSHALHDRNVGRRAKQGLPCLREVPDLMAAAQGPLSP